MYLLCIAYLLCVGLLSLWELVVPYLKNQEKIKLNLKKKIYAGVCYNKLIILSFILGNKKYILLRRKSNLIVVHNRWCLFNILFLKVIKNTIHIFLNQGFVEKQSFFFFWKKRNNVDKCILMMYDDQYIHTGTGWVSGVAWTGLS